MGFLVYHIHLIEADRIGLRLIRPLTIGGEQGLFSKHIPAMAAANEKWELSAQALLSLAGLEGGESLAILFDLTPRSPEKLDLYELISVSGRTVSIITDALFHFKVACSGVRTKFAASGEDELIIPNWRHRPDRYEQMRLEGGVKGGNWAWSEPPQAMSATVL
jgi:hypothetical protein